MSRRHALGCRPDTIDQRDLPFVAALMHLPASVSLRSQMPPVLDQGNLGSCTAHGLANAFRYSLAKHVAASPFMPSRLMLYYCERKMEGTIATDAGAEIRDGAKVLHVTGCSSEALWPYDVAKFAQSPPQAAWVDAPKHETVSYHRVANTEHAIRAALASGFPVVVGASLYASFESAAVAKTGTVPMPQRSEELLGGHCFLVCGYDDGTRRLLCQNSWGTGWGDAGFFTLPYGYLTANGADYWVIQTVTP